MPGRTTVAATGSTTVTVAGGAASRPVEAWDGSSRRHGEHRQDEQPGPPGERRQDEQPGAPGERRAG
ncbi:MULTISPECIES: hypothetical protein [unclassified Streptomyces]|uniref:hypothetical protein n=1 Tax=unclassified Streptomyces TaxID=2593676 RepID=UPI003691584B